MRAGRLLPLFLLGFVLATTATATSQGDYETLSGEAFAAITEGDVEGARKTLERRRVLWPEAPGVLCILGASNPMGAAEEREGNGLFTRALLDGLAGRAGDEGDDDGQIDLSELVAFITIEVKRESKFDQDPAIVFDSDVPPVIASVPED